MKQNGKDATNKTINGELKRNEVERDMKLWVKDFIVLHAGTKCGIIEKLAWYFLYFQEYYHDSMNKELFEKWLKEKLLPTQPGGAIVNYYG
ncbi:hypothetical protein NQ315_002220 [Exocentrus adspersus]|uniref:Uncharacterized protein n=1 Tax=Exocentrus adspersus TaxID=1586481 RepID=A0AAV8VZ80_9CUCU|nr:hypothetical protein NQ315_002220 [Exocentrus adspersus]